jgi:hypothetical protein
MEEKQESLKKTSTVRVPLEPLDCWNLSKNSGNRQFSSVSRVRNRLLSHELPPAGDDKTILKIQKKLDALSSIQSKLITKSPSETSPPRQLSARRARVGVTYRPSEKVKSNIIEIPAKSTCASCKTLWAGSTLRKNCDLCASPKAKYAFEVEFKVVEDSRGSLIIGNKEIAINLNGKFRTVVAVMVEEENTFDFTQDWNEFTRVATPSFHLNTDQDVSFTSNVSFPADVSFNENSKVFELTNELECILKKQGQVLNEPSMNRIQDVCQQVCKDYLAFVAKAAACVGSDVFNVVEKGFKGFTQFFDSCLISLIRYICQLKESNDAALESEKRYAKKIGILNRLLKRNETTSKSYSARNY